MTDHTAADARFGRVARVVGGVLREALRSTGARAIVLLDAESAGGVMVARIADYAGITLADSSSPAECLIAHPASKTALLVGSSFPRADLFPLGDLYATQIALLAGGETAEEGVVNLAEVAGGLARLDEVLMRHIDGRLSLSSGGGLTSAAGQRIADALQGSRFQRSHAGLVPKLGPRTIGVDLLD